MRRLRIFLLAIVYSVAVTALVFAHRPIFSDKKADDAGTAIHIEEPDISQVVYRELSAMKPTLWLEMNLGENFELYVQIGLPLLQRLEVFRPAVAVIGPGLPDLDLPFDIPEGAGGILLRTEDVHEPRVFHEPFTRTDSWILRSRKLHLEEAGTYHVVAFSPQGESGKLWLSVGERESFGAADFLKFSSWTRKIRAFHELDAPTGEEAAETVFEEQETDAEERLDPEQHPDGILDLLTEAGRFTVLLKAIDQAGLSEVLRQDGPFTVFAPTDAAFARLPGEVLNELLKPGNKQQLKNLLQRHVLSGRCLLSHRPLETLAGDAIHVQYPGFLLAEGVKVLHPDIAASNGVVHVLDDVLTQGTDQDKRNLDLAGALIETAITKGATLFNDGQISECVTIYASTVRVLDSILADQLTGKMHEEVARAVDDVLKMENPRDQAWRYRKILDDIYSRLQDVSEDKVQNSAQSLLIDDFTRDDGLSTFGSRWNLLSDRVMGGVSTARSRYDVVDGSRCLVMEGEVSLENNGGFIQVAHALQRNGRPFDAGGYRGIRLRVRGNDQPYYVHLRTAQSMLPWQYFSAPFRVESEWRLIDIPFDRFEPQALSASLDKTALVRIAIVGAKKEYAAEVAISRLEFYR